MVWFAVRSAVWMRSEWMFSLLIPYAASNGGPPYSAGLRSPMPWVMARLKRGACTDRRCPQTNRVQEFMTPTDWTNYTIAEPMNKKIICKERSLFLLPMLMPCAVRSSGWSKDQKFCTKIHTARFTLSGAVRPDDLQAKKVKKKVKYKGTEL